MLGKNLVYQYLGCFSKFRKVVRPCISVQKFGTKQTLLSYDVEATRGRKKPMHGTRYLIAEKVFQFNVWDDVPWDEDQEKEAMNKVSHNSQSKVPAERITDLEENADKYWDTFYDVHQNRFFKDRNWLFTEFPELDPSRREHKPNKCLKIFEIGCGVGNTVFPILRQCSPESEIFIYASDFSSNAISILKENPEYNEKKCHAFVLDATSDEWNPPFQEASLDIVVIIFALSSINPDKFKTVARQIYKFLAPGGLVLVRDYGRYDLVQLRFKDGQCLKENFYVRGDGTRVYFFTQDDMKNLFEEAGFLEEQNLVDRRLQVNRGKMLKMYRVFIQGKYRKPANPVAGKDA